MIWGRLGGDLCGHAADVLVRLEALARDLVAQLPVLVGAEVELLLQVRHLVVHAAREHLLALERAVLLLALLRHRVEDRLALPQLRLEAGDLAHQILALDLQVVDLGVGVLVPGDGVVFDAQLILPQHLHLRREEHLGAR
jgi:hypothetical protein